MSGYVTGWVLKNSDAKGAARLVLLVLADHASSDGTNSWPSVETIQWEARLGARSTVQRALRDLQDDGAIRKAGTAGRGQTNWTVVLEGPHLMLRGGRTTRPKPSLLTVQKNRPWVLGVPIGCGSAMSNGDRRRPRSCDVPTLIPRRAG